VRLLLLLAVALAGCAAPAPTGLEGVDPLTAALLDEFGLRAAGPTSSRTVHLDDPTDWGWAVQLEVSRKAGLDFSPFGNREAELRTTPIDHPGGTFSVHTLVLAGRIVGAWASEETSSGAFPLNELPAGG
jgi:hypothetical protein